MAIHEPVIANRTLLADSSGAGGRPQARASADPFRKGLESQMKRFGVPERPRPAPCVATTPRLPAVDRQSADGPTRGAIHPDDLALVVAAWPKLSEAVRQGILTLVRADRTGR